MKLKCDVCSCVLPGDEWTWPCGVVARYYVTREGIIVGKSNECPHEEPKPGIYLPTDMLHQSKQAQDELFNTALNEVSYEDYENLWSAWNGKNHILDRDPKRALKEWLSSFPSRVSFTLDGSHGRGEKTRAAAIKFVELAEAHALEVRRKGLPLVPDATFGVLPPTWYAQTGNIIWL